jgi:hypothetical protein
MKVKKNVRHHASLDPSQSFPLVILMLEFDRIEFGVRYGSGKFFQNLGDKGIADKFQLNVQLVCKLPLQLGAN